MVLALPERADIKLRHPGSLVMKVKEHADKEQINDISHHITKYICDLHETSEDIIRRIFKEYSSRTIDENPEDFVNSDYAIKMMDQLSKCTYPYMYISQKTIENVNIKKLRKKGPYEKVLAHRPYYSEFAAPTILKPYLRKQILALLNRGYEIEVGSGVNPVPILYAIERNELDADLKDRHAELLSVVFPVPDVTQVEDDIVDAISPLNSDGIVSSDSFRHFQSVFWRNFFDKISYGNMLKDVPNLPGYSKYLETKEKLNHYGDTFSFDTTNLSTDGETEEGLKRRSAPLHLYTAARTDFSLTRLKHYTKTKPKHFQKIVLFTNYNKYFGGFVIKALKNIMTFENCSLVISYDNGSKKQPGKKINRATIHEILKEKKIPFQEDDLSYEKFEPYIELIAKSILEKMPDCQFKTLHFLRPDEPWLYEDQKGLAPHTIRTRVKELMKMDYLPSLTLMNIGVGPSNAKNATDHVAVLRPLAWIMVGHCGGVRTRQKLGDYVIAKGIMRDDQVLDRLLPMEVPIECSATISASLDEAIKIKNDYFEFEILKGEEALHRAREMAQTSIENKADQVRHGVVFSTADRNWETLPADDTRKRFDLGRVVTCDMETATLAANGLRHRVKCGSLLCMSDKPLHGQMKMSYFSDTFYKEQVDKHLDITIASTIFLVIDFESWFELENSREQHTPNNPPFR